jgi:hypothetical protein
MRRLLAALDSPSGSPLRIARTDTTDEGSAAGRRLAAPSAERRRWRIAYLGIGYGGAMGALFVGIERRLKAAELVVADGGLVSHFTGPEDLNFMTGLP